jgi:hypothetical protein
MCKNAQSRFVSKRCRTILIALNILLLLAGLWLGVRSFASEIPVSRRSRGEIEVAIQSTADVEKLRSIIMADDAVIRADRELAERFRGTAIIGSGVAVLVAFANIALLSLRKDTST